MSHIILRDYREPAAESAYEIAYEFLERSGGVRDEFEACVFLAQRLTKMVEEGESNRIAMANRAISEYEAFVAGCERLIRCGSCRGDQ